MKFKCVLFDVDGTLVNSTDAHARAWEKAFNEFGFRISIQDLYKDIGMGGKEIVRKHTGAKANEKLEEKICKRQRELFLREFLLDVKPFPSASELLKKLHLRRVKVYFASSSPRELIEKFIDLLGIREIVSDWVSGEEVKKSKPAPDIFLAVFRECKANTESTVVIGDSPYDVEAARRAGFPCIALLQSGFSREELKNADFIFENIEELMERMDELFEAD